MFGFICSALALVVLFFITAFALVKLYEYGIRSWFVQTVLVVFGVFHFISRPNDYVYSSTALSIYWTIALACMVVIDTPSGTSYHPNNQQKNNEFDDAEHSNNHSSSVQTFLDFLLLYSIFSYFDDDDNW